LYLGSVLAPLFYSEGDAQLRWEVVGLDESLPGRIFISYGREPDPPKAWPKSVIQVMLRTWPVSMLAATYMPSERRWPSGAYVAEPGPEDLANDQREEPHHGQAPASAGVKPLLRAAIVKLAAIRLRSTRTDQGGSHRSR
jgi:hypothetical protein